MRQPPAAGPRAVEWTAMIVLRPLLSSSKAWTASCPSNAGESNKVMPETEPCGGRIYEPASSAPSLFSQPRGSAVGWRRRRRPWDWRRAGRQRRMRVAEEREHVGHHHLTLPVAGEQMVAVCVVGAAVG